MAKKKEMQYLLHRFREETGQEQVDMHELARYAVSKGWPLPTPKSPLDRLAEQFASAAREEMRKDEVTGRPYRANLAVTGPQGTFWVDIDAAPRKIAHKAFIQRREQMVGDAVQLTFDVLHWNRINPGDAPIDMPLDLGPDVEWKLNAPGEDEQAA